MTGMWRRWARRRRIVGLSYMGGAAVAIAAAVLVFITAPGLFTGVFIGALTGAAIALLILAGVEFGVAHKYARRGGADGLLG